MATLALDAWDAQTGQHLWRAVVIPPEPGNLGLACNPYATPTPTDFNTTVDGRWAIFSRRASGTCNFCDLGGEVINMATGATRTDPLLAGTLGNYVVDGPLPQEPHTGPVSVTDPANGKQVGAFTFAYYDNDPGISFYGATSEFLPLALREVFPTESMGSSPQSGLSLNGQRLLAYNESDTNLSEGLVRTVTSFALPNMTALWQATGFTYLVGDGGGTLLALRDAAQGGSELVALNDATGQILWTLPSAGVVCGVTNTEIAFAANGDLAVLDVTTGKQITYYRLGGSGECPAMILGGREVTTTGNLVTVVQRLRP
jgi:hypothetical protein